MSEPWPERCDGEDYRFPQISSSRTLMVADRTVFTEAFRLVVS